MQLVLSFLVILTTLGQVQSISDEAKKLVEDWAPLVWIHPDEKFYPSSVPFHLANTQVNDGDDNVKQSNPSADSILAGSGTESFHLNTKKPMDCANCFQEFFSGEALLDTPMYTFVTEHKDDCSTVDVTYAAFYPFNYGKDVCVGLEEFGVCLGEKRTFGNHVGDWEHVSMRFKNGEPFEIYLGVHSFGAWYSWNRNENRFDFARGEPLWRKTVREGKTLDVKIDVDYPDFLFLEEGHPAVYSALGSHGVWSMPGKHTYLHILTVHLDDYAERGSGWRSWQKLKIYETAALDSFTGDDTWINFRGRWGNTKKLGCELEPLVGECSLVGGPTGPAKYFSHDFPQPPPC